MIPSIRSISELMAITQARGMQDCMSRKEVIDSLPEDSGQRKRYVRSLNKTKVKLPDLPKSIRHEWIDRKELISRFFDKLDYNNQIQSTYDLTLLERQNKVFHKDVA
tara:strand:+ start:275 stop:595 length:321 start_codon:yes stop_codon:yes gene_type:complete